ncbi:hypothetical protein CCHR01_18773 [Colletotrichum chrysophilum]|uniref:Uncharacterized protein n=1 Tax=Colletotrichum chrysophilum TaxID=1836956 RepID=A0AAD9E8K2_9PEZI|nr:hypothetical protein CCHR01_18773 [Colletotrichum chrysophilum]
MARHGAEDPLAQAWSLQLLSCGKWKEGTGKLRWAQGRQSAWDVCELVQVQVQVQVQTPPGAIVQGPRVDDESALVRSPTREKSLG